MPGSVNAIDTHRRAMSSPAVDRFVKFLVMKCERTSNTEFVDRLLALADEAILAGKGSVGFLMAASGNGKSVTQAEALTCDEVGFACEKALQIYNEQDGSSPIAFPDFSDMMQKRTP